MPVQDKILRFAGLSLSLLLAACSGGSNPALGPTASNGGGCTPGSADADCGTVLVAVTDADGDFASYTVEIESIALERADGGFVETLPAATRVDFAELTELSDLLSAATIAPGDLVGGRIRIDYSDAEIFVEANGELVPVAVEGIDGMPLGIVDFEIRLANRDRLFLRAGRTAFLNIDFDLAASHSVDTTVSPPRVVAEPFLIADVALPDAKELRVRGALADVDEEQGTYQVRVRPRHHMAGDHGPLTVHTTSTTEFEIDGEVFVGADGLAALAAEPAGTLTAAFGTLSLSEKRFTASIVHAGDSLAGDHYSAVYGNIVARADNRLVVKAALIDRRSRRAHFHRTVLVDVGPNTGVGRLGDANGSYDIGNLSVGQRIAAFGVFADDAEDDGVTSTDPFRPDVALVLDATEGRVRMHPTRLSGAVVAVMQGQINMSLRAIDRLGIDLFDFHGTGVTEESDADPTNYEVAIGTLAIDQLAIDAPTRVIGFTAPFGAAPPDFEGRTLVGPRDIRSALGVGWGLTGTSAPFSVMNADSLVVALDNPDIGLRHHLLLGHRLVDLFELPASPAVTPGDIRGLYGISEPGHVEIFAEFAEFVDELGLRLSEADRARALAAYGRFDTSANSLTTHRVLVSMLPAEAP